MPSPAVRRKSAPVSRFLGLLALAATLSGCWEGINREALATILSIDGKAETSSDGRRPFSELRLADHPGKGTRLRTTSGSHVALAPLPNSLVQVDGDTSLEIVRIALTKDGNETGSNIRDRFVDLRVTAGRILASHAWGEALARFTVTTPHGELIVVSDALFWLEVNADRTRITCASGSVAFRPKNTTNPTRITSGFVAETSGNELNLTPADASPVSQESVVGALELEQKLRDLATRNRNVLPR